MSKRKRNYSIEFKKKAMELSLARGSVIQICRELDIPTWPYAKNRTKCSVQLDSTVQRGIFKLPKFLEPFAHNPSVMCRMFWVTMSKVVLDQPEIISFVGQIKTTGMSKCMGVDIPKFGLFRCGRNNIVHGLSGQRQSTFIHEQPWKIVFSRGEIPFNCSKLVPRDRVFYRKTIFKPRHPNSGFLNIYVCFFQLYRFAYPESMSIDHK